MKTPIETGWTPRLSHGCRIRQKELLDCVFQLATRRDELGIDWILADDGWQSALGDWTDCNSKFPDGLSFLAKQIHEFGFQTAVWMAPFLAEQDSRLAEEHPEWLLQDKSGFPDFSIPWRDSSFAAVLDVTLPEVREYLKTTCCFLKKSGIDRIVMERNLHGYEMPMEIMESGLPAVEEIFSRDRILVCGEGGNLLSPADVIQILNGTCGILPVDAPENLLLASGLMAQTAILGGDPAVLEKDSFLRCADFLEMRGKYRKLRELKSPEGGWNGLFENLAFQEQIYAFFNLTEHSLEWKISCPDPLSRFFSIEEYHPVKGVVKISLKGRESMLCTREIE